MRTLITVAVLAMATLGAVWRRRKTREDERNFEDELKRFGNELEQDLLGAAVDRFGAKLDHLEVKIDEICTRFINEETDGLGTRLENRLSARVDDLERRLDQKTDGTRTRFKMHADLLERKIDNLGAQNDRTEGQLALTKEQLDHLEAMIGTLVHSTEIVRDDVGVQHLGTRSPEDPNPG